MWASSDYEDHAFLRNGKGDLYFFAPPRNISESDNEDNSADITKIWQDLKVALWPIRYCLKFM
jgi:hypothetical protein